jgi:hypothetical protein
MLRPVFDLRVAHDDIAAVQDATINSSWAGLIPDHGLFGSREWWEAVDDGDIPTHTLSGTIARVYMSGHNDYPEFEVIADGATSSWTRRGDDDTYVVGRGVVIEYVLQRYKTPLEGVGEHFQCVLRILIEDDSGGGA